MFEILMVGPYPDWDMEALDADYRIHRLWLEDDQPAYLAAHGASIRAIATRGDLGATAAQMALLPRLEIVACYGVGVDAIDLSYTRANGIAVTNTPDVLTGDVADLAIGLLLAASRTIVAGDAFVRSGAWAESGMPLSSRVWGKRIGIVGMGRIGAAVARRAAAFDCTISYFSRSLRDDLPYAFFADLAELARGSDVLIVTLAGGEASRGLIDAGVLDALGPDGILINVSRGTTVDEPALIAALQARRIRAAGLDVFLNEPAIDERFFGLDNVVLQPHQGSGTVETRRAMGKIVRDNLAAHFAGRPLLTPVD